MLEIVYKEDKLITKCKNLVISPFPGKTFSNNMIRILFCLPSRMSELEPCQ